MKQKWPILIFSALLTAFIVLAGIWGNAQFEHLHSGSVLTAQHAAQGIALDGWRQEAPGQWHFTFTVGEAIPSLTLCVTNTAASLASESLTSLERSGELYALDVTPGETVELVFTCGRSPQTWLMTSAFASRAFRFRTMTQLIALTAFVTMGMVLLALYHYKHLPELEAWLRSYKPEELFNEDGTPVELVASFPPTGSRRMGANPHANGGLLLRDLRTPDFRDYAVDVKSPGAVETQDMYVLGTYVRDVMKLNLDARNFRIFAPDETASNRLQAVFDVTGRRFLDHQLPDIDENLDPDGRVMDSMLSEHFCEGFLEGYLLTGRHGFFDSYEAFIRIVDSMFSQHAKWLKMCNELPWRQDIASLNYILASNVWQQDHNGFTHQDPGFLDHVANKKADVVRMYLPPDANCLLSCFDHCIKSRNYVNVIVASKHPRPQWLTMEQAVKHCTQGIGIWEWASNDAGCEPDVVMACCGDTPTLETLAAVSILRKELPELKIRVVNVVDLMKLQPHTEHPHGLTDEEYDTLFTRDKPIIFAYHGYPTLIHELTYRRHNRNLHVRGYKEEGTITTPFDMRVLNDIDRFDLVIDTVRRLPQLGNRGAYLVQKMNDKLVEHRQYIRDNGIDLPEVRNWKWEG